ncbi:hypothetical protein KSP40_PGU009438 [Platanthera guangdongensis]|uniref:Uncharacterized protein n=1 Tax=Platanthera guangdongensis TaxID=2320717 RepID=A0ABR2MW74_9ASPA
MHPTVCLSGLCGCGRAKGAAQSGRPTWPPTGRLCDMGDSGGAAEAAWPARLWPCSGVRPTYVLRTFSTRHESLPRTLESEVPASALNFEYRTASILRRQLNSSGKTVLCNHISAQNQVKASMQRKIRQNIVDESRSLDRSTHISGPSGIIGPSHELLEPADVIMVLTRYNFKETPYHPMNGWKMLNSLVV